MGDRLYGFALFGEGGCDLCPRTPRAAGVRVPPAVGFSGG